MRIFSICMGTLLILNSAQARTFRQANGGSTTSSTVDSGRSGTVNSGTATESCSNSSKISESNNTISLNFLKRISLNPKDLKIFVNKAGQAVVSLPAMISGVCLSLGAETISQDNKLFVRFTNNADLTAYGDQTVSMAEKYYRCMEKQPGYLNKDGSFNKDKIGVSNFSKKFGNLNSKKMKVVIGSPTLGDYKIGHHAKISSHPTNWKCLTYEKLYGDRSNKLISLDEQRAEEHVAKICSAGDIEEMIAFREDSPYSRLNRIIDKVLVKSTDKYTSDIMSKLKKIENRLRKNDVSEDTAQDLAAEYVKQVKLFEKVVINPLTQQVDELLVKLKDADDGEARSIKKKIVSINKKIQKFAKHWRSSKDSGIFKRVQRVLRKYGLTSEGAEINRIYLKSKYMARVYKGSASALGKKMSRSEARKKISKSDDHFRERVIPIWDDTYAANQGDKEPIERRQKQIQSLQKKMYSTAQSFQQNEQKTQQKYCGNSFGMGPANPTRCQSFMSERSLRMRLLERKLTAMEGGLQGMQSSYGDMITGYNHYQDQAALEESDSEFYNDFRLTDDAYSSVPGSLFTMASNDPRRQPAFSQNSYMSQFGPNGMPSQYGTPMTQFGQPGYMFNPQFNSGYQMNFGGQGSFGNQPQIRNYGRR